MDRYAKEQKIDSYFKHFEIYGSNSVVGHEGSITFDSFDCAFYYFNKTSDLYNDKSRTLYLYLK